MHWSKLPRTDTIIQEQPLLYRIQKILYISLGQKIFSVNYRYWSYVHNMTQSARQKEAGVVVGGDGQTVKPIKGIRLYVASDKFWQKDLFLFNDYQITSGIV